VINYRQHQPRRNKSLFVLGLLVILSIQTYCQSKDIIINKDSNNLSWIDFVNKIEQEYAVHFYYNSKDIPDLKISGIDQKTSLIQVLSENLKKYGVFVSIDETGNIFLTKETPIQVDLPGNYFHSLYKVNESLNSVAESKNKNVNNDFLKTQKDYVTKTFVVGTNKKGANQTHATIKGHVKNAVSGDPIIGATIYNKALDVGVVTNNDGFFEIQLKKGIHVLAVRSINSKENKVEVEILSDGSLDLFLEDQTYMLQDVVISAQKYSKVKETRMGIEKLTAKSVKEIPLVLGEKDIIKVALLLPGIQTVGEGSSGFNVRGSPTDQNLFYINNLPIYNTSHLSGFFSSFNSDAIEEFILYKSNIPVEYGGRLSSVFNITAKKGSLEKIKVNGGISPITGRILVEGPLKKDKSSFLIGIRSTYSDWLLKKVKDPDIKNSSANFGDLVTNFSLSLGPSDNLNVFTYFSYDKINLANKTKYNYENKGASISWKHTFNKNLFFDLGLVHSIYDFDEESNELEIASFKQANKLEHSEAKAKFIYNLNEKHSMTFGINSILYRIDRGKYEPLSDQSLIEFLDLGKEKAIEAGLFVSDEWKVTPKLTINGGLRFNLYSYLGPQKVYQYIDGLPMIEENIQDILYFKNNEAIKTYNGLDIRAAASYLINEDLSLKASYNKTHQYIYMLSNSIQITPNYKWKLTDYNTKPMVGTQYSAGIFSNLFNNNYEFSAEAYYKHVNNLIEIKDGVDLFLSEHIERSALQGNLTAYGIEFMIKKKSGKFNGWLNYTYSKSRIKVDSEYPESRINFGKQYASNYDKPHALNLVANYRISKRLVASGIAVYSTGRPITYPTSIYYLNGVRTINYSKRNEYRIPDYFRVDLSFTWEGNLKKNKFAHGSWSFSVYNLTGRKNAYSVYFKNENGSINGYKRSIFGTQIWSITYNFKIGNYAN